MNQTERARTAKAKLKQYGYKQQEVADILDISLVSMNRKLNGLVPINPEEWKKIINLRDKFKEDGK